MTCSDQKYVITHTHVHCKWCLYHNREYAKYIGWRYCSGVGTALIFESYFSAVGTALTFKCSSKIGADGTVLQIALKY